MFIFIFSLLSILSYLFFLYNRDGFGLGWGKSGGTRVGEHRGVISRWEAEGAEFFMG